MQRQRLNDFMHTLDHRERLARRILLALAISGVLLFMLAACRLPYLQRLDDLGTVTNECRAIPAAKNRDARAVLTCTTYRCANGHRFESEDYDLMNKSTAP